MPFFTHWRQIQLFSALIHHCQSILSSLPIFVHHCTFYLKTHPAWSAENYYWCLFGSFK